MTRASNRISIGAPVEAAEAGFAVDGVSLELAGRRILDNVSLDFPAGETVALVGHNGSGKSTLLKMMARQAVPTTGEIRFRGRRLADFSARDFAREIAFMPQDTGVAPGMTVGELVASGRYPWHGALGRFSTEDADKVAAALAATQMTEFASRRVDTLSGGERQRAWIAMLLAQDSRCLLLDEPTAALDIGHQIEVLSLVRALSHQRGLSVILVLHDINMAARFCDRIHALKAGSVVASGHPSQLIRRDTLVEIYGVAMDVIAHPGRSGESLAYVC